MSRTKGTKIRSGLEPQESSVRHCYSKADRLLQRAQFVYLATKARKISNRYFIVFFEASPRQRSRIGITASRKVGNAVTRNRIKRLSREFFRANRSLFTRSWDLHVVAKKEAAGGCSQTIFLSLEKLFRRIESFQDE